MSGKIFKYKIKEINELTSTLNIRRNRGLESFSNLLKGMHGRGRIGILLHFGVTVSTEPFQDAEGYISSCS